jgi:hypothetical protein
MRLVNVIVAVGDVCDGSATTGGWIVGVAVGADVGTAVSGATDGEWRTGVALGPKVLTAATGLDDADAVGRTEPGPAA